MHRMAAMNRAAATRKGNVYQLERGAGSIAVRDIAGHRNGVDGAPFHVVTFEYDGGTGRGVEPFVATVFEGAGQVAVLSVGRVVEGDVGFGSNSWRGDLFEAALRTAIRLSE